MAAATASSSSGSPEAGRDVALEFEPGSSRTLRVRVRFTRHKAAQANEDFCVLFLEDVNEHPYRVERSLLQLHQAGVLDAQKAVLLGAFTEWKKSPLDRGYTLKSMVQTLRGVTRTPILTGLPFGHVPTKVTLPVGARVELVVQGRDVLIGWG